MTRREKWRERRRWRGEKKGAGEEEREKGVAKLMPSQQGSDQGKNAACASHTLPPLVLEPTNLELCLHII